MTRWLDVGPQVEILLAGDGKVAGERTRRAAGRRIAAQGDAAARRNHPAGGVRHPAVRHDQVRLGHGAGLVRARQAVKTVQIPAKKKVHAKVKWKENGDEK